jgi:hypothetical protein
MNKRKRDYSEQQPSPENLMIRSILKPIGRLPLISSPSSFHHDHLQSINHGKLFPSGDLLLSLPSSSSTIHLYKDAIYSSHPIQCSFEINSNSFDAEDAEDDLPFPPFISSYSDSSSSSTHQSNRHYILSSSSGKILFLLTNTDSRLSKIEYDLFDSAHEETLVTAIASSSSHHDFSLFGTSNNEIYLVGRDQTSTRVISDLTTATTRIFCYKLRKPKMNLFSDWIETGSRLLGFGWGTTQEVKPIGTSSGSSTWTPSNSILKLLPFESFPSVASPGLGAAGLVATSLLLSMNSSNLTLWELYQHSTLSSLSHSHSADPSAESSFISPFNSEREDGQEKLYWEINLQLLLEADMNHQLSSVITNHSSSFASSSKGASPPKIQRKFQFLDLHLLSSTTQECDLSSPSSSSSPYSASASGSTSPTSPNQRKKCIHLALLSLVIPTPSASSSLPRDSHLLHPELWLHILQVDVTSPHSSPAKQVNEISLTSPLAAQQSVCQLKLRRRVAILNPAYLSSPFSSFSSSSAAVAGKAPTPPRLLPGNHSHSLIVAWYDLPRAPATAPAATTSIASLHCVELTDLHHYTSPSYSSSPSERTFQELSLADPALSSSTPSDSTAYSDYFLLHDTMTNPSSSRVNANANASNNSSGALQKSNLCEGIGADTGIVISSIVSFESLRQRHSHSQEFTDMSSGNGSRKGLTIITAGSSPSLSLLVLPLPGSPLTFSPSLLFCSASG